MTPRFSRADLANAARRYAKIVRQDLLTLTRRISRSNIANLVSVELNDVMRVKRSTLPRLPHVFFGGANTEMVGIAAGTIMARMHNLL